MTENGGGMFNMPVIPAYGMGNGGGGFGGWGGDGWWIILLLLVLGGWGNNGIGGNGGGFGGGNGGLYPWMNQANQMNEGFQNQLLNDNITSIRDGVTNISTQLCNGFAGVANGFAQAEIAANNRQMADMNQNFALQSQLSQCCCDNRMATMQTQNVVQTEGAATRLAIQQQTQAILDLMCEDKIDAKNELISQLRQELLFARGQASQDVQTATLRAGQIAEADAIYERLNNCPVGTVPVYGRQPIFTCGNNGCGCGMG